MRFALVIFLMVACVAKAQVFLPHRKAMGTTETWTPLSIPTIRYWWVHTDMSTNTKVSTWTDRIQSAILEQSTASLQPSNLAAGVQFDGTDWLLNNPTFKMTNAVYTNEQSFFAIITPTTPSASWGFFLGSSDSTFGDGLGTENDGEFFFSGAVGSLSMGTFTTGDPVDFAFTSDEGSNNYFVDGSLVSGPVSGQGLWQYQEYVGKHDSFAAFYAGYIRELIFFSNALTSSDILNLHNYGVATYGY
jgi:hypothetical protein